MKSMNIKIQMVSVMPSKLSIIGILLLSFSVLLPLNLVAQSDEFTSRPEDETVSLYKESSKDIEARFNWFMEGRADENGEIPVDVRINAWKQIKSMSVHTPNVFLKSGKVADSRWKNIGPRNRGGRITGIAVHPTNHEIVYFTAADGGVWKSTNAGDDFVPVADDMPTMSMGSITIDPSNPDIVWVGTGEANGSSYIYPGIGIIKSTDAGLNWEITGYESSTRVAEIEVHPTISEIVLAATWAGLERTEDNGETWTRVRSGRAYDVMAHPTKPERWFAAMRGSGVWRSDDTGRTWESLSLDWQDDHGVKLSSITRLAFDLCTSEPETMYVTLVNGSGFSLLANMKSTDGGDTWEKLPQPGSDLFSGQGFYNCDIAVDPSDPDRVLIGGLWIYLSLNGGQSWSSRRPKHVDQHALAFSASNPSYFYAGHDGGFDRSTNGGANYVGLSARLPLSQYYDIDVSYTNPELVIGGTQDNGSHLGNASDPDWKRVTGADGMFSVIDYQDPNNMYTEMQYGQSHWRSTNGGNNWVAINAGIEGTGPWVTPVVIHPTNPSILYTVTNTHLYKTTNRGALWFKLAETVTSSATIREIGLSPANPEHMATGYSGSSGVATSTDGGLTWERSTPTPTRKTVSDLDYHPTDPNTFYVTVLGNGANSVFMTTDHGQSWKSISGNLPSLPTNTIEINPDNTQQMWVGTDLSVLTTIDGGENWEVLADGMPRVAVIDLKYHGPTGLLRAGTHGRSIYELVAATPVDLETFSAVLEGSNIMLQWRTSFETNNAGFAIERKDGSAEIWTEIGYVEGNGSGAGIFSYTFADNNLPVGTDAVVYRLKQIDFDGSYDYSSEAFVSLGSAAAISLALDQNYPNPFNPVTTIRYSVPEAAHIQMIVTDAKGIEVATLVNGESQPGAYTVSFDASEITSGVYFYHIISDGQRITRKMLLLK
jgi:photosystem II stability/assembly factor-like uncharacterized protein